MDSAELPRRFRLMSMAGSNQPSEFRGDPWYAVGSMKWIDGHLDLAFVAVSGRDLRVPITDTHAGCVSLPALRAGNVEIAFATIFTEPGGRAQPWSYDRSDPDSAERAGLRQLEQYERLEAEGEIFIARCGADLDDGSSPRPMIVLLMEGADPIRSPERVAQWHDRGLRMIGLTWAEGTRYAGGDSAHGPLSPLGRELVHAMDELGMIHDASHLADEAFDDLFENARGPIVATHSNCRALVNDRQRHLRDDQIKRIGERGGIIGLNLFAPFVVAQGTPTVADAINHVERIADLMDHRDGVALGSDMDGGFRPERVAGGLRPESLDLLAHELASRGWGQRDVEKFAHGNWSRLLRKNL